MQKNLQKSILPIRKSIKIYLILALVNDSSNIKNPYQTKIFFLFKTGPESWKSLLILAAPSPHLTENLPVKPDF